MKRGRGIQKQTAVPLVPTAWCRSPAVRVDLMDYAALFVLDVIATVVGIFLSLGIGRSF